MYQTYEMEKLCPGCNHQHTLVYEGKEPNSVDPVIYQCTSTKRYFRVRGMCVWCEQSSIPEDAVKLISIKDIEV